MYVCICKGITDKDIRDAVDNGVETIKGLKQHFAVGSQCGGCITLLNPYFNKYSISY